MDKMWIFAPVCNMDDKEITNEDFNVDTKSTNEDSSKVEEIIITNEDFNVDFDTLLLVGTSDTTIPVDDEMEQFFDNIYKEIFQEYFAQLLFENE